MKNSIILVVSSVFILTTINVAAKDAATPKFSKNVSYDSARDDLRSLGWTPVRAKNQNCAPGFEKRCNNYPEAVLCRGTGSASCEMLWKKGQSIIEIDTVGEVDPPSVNKVTCRVNC